MAVALIILFAALGFAVSPNNPNDLRVALSNPVTPIQTLALTLDQNENYGPFNRTQSVLDIEPVFFTNLNEAHWIHRLRLPVLQQPELDQNADSMGIGDFSYKGFYAGLNSGKWKWGVGPWILLPTASKRAMGSGKYSVGPAVVLLYQDGPLSLGGMVTQAWSIAGDSERDDVNTLEADPLVSMIIGEKTTIDLLDTIYLNWDAPEGNKLTVPMGVKVRQLFRSKKEMPVEGYVGVFGNVIRPDNASDWYWTIGVNMVLSK